MEMIYTKQILYCKNLLIDLKKNAVYLSITTYIAILALSIVFFLLEFYLVSIYFIVAAIYLTYFSNILPCDKAIAEKLQEEIESADYDGISHNFPLIAVLIFLSLLGIYFNFFIAKIYLFFLISTIVIRTLGFKMSTMILFAIRMLKSIRKDMIVLKYHWFTTLKKFRNINHINIATLLISLVLGSTCGNLLSEFAAYWNYILWNCLLGLHCIFVIIIDIYILFFLNMPAQTPIASTCVRCIAGASGVLLCNYNLAESGIGPQTPFVNWVRTVIDQPHAWDNESVKVYKAMKANFPKIDESRYLAEKPSSALWFDNVKVFEVDKQAAWDVAKEIDRNQLNRLNVSDQKTLRVYDLVNKVADKWKE